MFAARYFANRYFAKRYWPNLGDVITEVAKDIYRVTMYIIQKTALVRFISRRLGVLSDR